MYSEALRTHVQALRVTAEWHHQAEDMGSQCCLV